MSPDEITWGNLGSVAEHYVSRPAYASRVIDALLLYVGGVRNGFTVADVGAGTGKLTEMLASRGLSGHAIEPSDGMSAGRRLSGPAADRFTWSNASAEDTGLPDNSVDWVCMATAFHWTDYPRALGEFQRILRPGGFFTAIWDLNDPKDDPLMRECEAMIEREASGLRRVQHEIYRLFEKIEMVLTDSGLTDLISIEAPHAETMSPIQYLDMWRSYHDVPSQIGRERWDQIIAKIEKRIEGASVKAHYRTHSWTVRMP